MEQVQHPEIGSTDPPGITVTSNGRVAGLTLNRPDRLNAISTRMARELALATARLARDPGISAVVLASSTPRGFCVGADLKERAGFSEAELLAQRPLFQEAFAGVRELPVPTIAAVSGYALGGGYELALSCDLIIADDTAVVGLPEVGVGLIPGCGGTQLLSRRTGRAVAADLLFTGRKVGAEEALRLGLVDRRAPAGQARAAALALAEEIVANSPLALRSAKRALADGADLGLADALRIEDDCWHEMASSPDRREGIAAFAEKRTPVWGPS